jgi:hypothetical protein
MDFCVFSTMALSSFASGALITTQGWTWLNLGSLVPIVTAGDGGAAVAGAAQRKRRCALSCLVRPSFSSRPFSSSSDPKAIAISPSSPRACAA